MDQASKKTDEIKDVLYVAQVRTDEHVHIDAYPSTERDLVLVSVFPNHWRCADCRSKGLIQKLVSAFTGGSEDFCPGCRAQNESNGFHARAKVAAIVKALRTGYTVADEYTSSTGTGHVNIKI